MLTVINIDTPKLGDRSYIAHDGSTAIVVDPQRDINRVQKILDREGLILGAVAETHMHNDYVSGGLQLARENDVPYVVSKFDPVSYERFAVVDKQIVPVGSFALQAIHTPGHTYTHMSYVLLDAEQVALGIFTGGSMLHGSTGRPDLLGADHSFELAGLQHDSIRKIAKILKDEVNIYPTHGFGSFCSSTPTSGDASIIADERATNPALTLARKTYVEHTLSALDAFPSYFKYMSPINLAGPALLNLSALKSLSADEVMTATVDGHWIADLRSHNSWINGHVAGTLSFGLDGSMASYLGWLYPYDKKLILISDNASDVSDAQIELARIGIDRPQGAHVGDFSDFHSLNLTKSATFKELPHALQEKLIIILDVRSLSERATSHIEPSMNIPLHELISRISEIPSGFEIWVHCASAYRATIAIGILEKFGVQAVLINDNYEACLLVPGLNIVYGTYKHG